jgi:hypothetical protein
VLINTGISPFYLILSQYLSLKVQANDILLQMLLISLPHAKLVDAS